MLYPVFCKKPSKKAIREAMQYSSIQEQMEALAYATAPTKNEVWRNINTGRLLIIKSEPIPIQGSPVGGNSNANFGVVVSDLLPDGEVDFDIFFRLEDLKNYEYIREYKS